MMRRRAVCAAGGLVGLGVHSAPTDVFARMSGTATATPDGAVRLGYFGTHFHRLVAPPGGAEAPTRWLDGTVGSLRLWDSGTRWGDIAPRPGAWSFERMDAYVAHAEAHRASVLYTLGSTPRWASARPDEPGPYGPGCAAEPVKLAHWEEYVARVAERYRGRIQAYELWNEPQFSDYALDRAHPGFFTGSMANMVEMARAARRVLDRIDPAAVLATPGFVNGPHRLELFLRSGGAETVQVVAYHFYARDARQFAQQVGDVREVMRRCGVADLPLWNTECGVETYEAGEALPEGITRRLTQADAADQLAQFLLLGAAGRLDRFYYYAWDNYRSGMIDRQGRQMPRFEALRRVQQWLLGAQVSRVEASGAAVSLGAERDGERFLFAWSDSPRVERVPVPPGWKITGCEGLLDDSAPAWPTPSGQASRVALSAAPVRLKLGRA